MRVSIFSDNGELLWWREANPPIGFASANYCGMAPKIK
jgi:hypothetical protein